VIRGSYLRVVSKLNVNLLRNWKRHQRFFGLFGFAHVVQGCHTIEECRYGNKYQDRDINAAGRGYDPAYGNEFGNPGEDPRVDADTDPFADPGVRKQIFNLVCYDSLPADVEKGYYHAFVQLR
jgi:hypothetical protein